MTAQEFSDLVQRFQMTGANLSDATEMATRAAEREAEEAAAAELQRIVADHGKP